jgi:hypothetical protein
MCLRNLFRTPTTHFTGTTTRFSIATAMVGLVDERDLRVRGPLLPHCNFVTI